MIYVVNINNKEYEVEVEKGKANLIKTTEVMVASPVTEKVAPAAPASQAPQVQETPAAPSNVTNGKTILAPMPGTILGIKANTGAKVKKGDVLIVLEAMKMENEIVAPQDGTVVQVVVTKGAAVDTNDIMMIIS